MFQKRRNLHVKVGDKVIVIAGDDRGKTGVVTEVDTKNNYVKVSGIRMQTHYKKKSENNPGSMEKKEGWLHASNVMRGKNNEN